MHGFMLYRRFGRVRSLRNDRAAHSDRSWLEFGRYVVTDRVRARSLRSNRSWLELGRYVPTELGSNSVATKRPSLACTWSDLPYSSLSVAGLDNRYLVRSRLE